MTWIICSGKKSKFKLVIEDIPSALYYTALLELGYMLSAIRARWGYKITTNLMLKGVNVVTRRLSLCLNSYDMTARYVESAASNTPGKS